MTAVEDISFRKEKTHTWMDPFMESPHAISPM